MGGLVVKILNFEGVFVPERDINEALNLAKELRLKSVYRFIHPVAIRIALKYALTVDDTFAKQQLTPEQEEAINKYVQQLLKDVEKMKQNHEPTF
jgi:transcription termination factor NusB